MIPVRRGAGEDGFTLFEAMIALAILTLGLGAFYRAIAAGASGEQRIERAATALHIAKARLAAEGTERPLVVGQHEGENPAGYHWSVNIRRYDGAAALSATSGTEAYTVTATVTWPSGRKGAHPSVELTTIKVGAAP